MKYPFKSLLLAATVLAAASCAKDDTQSGGEETAGPVIVNASPAAIGGEIILKLKTEASGIVEKSRRAFRKAAASTRSTASSTR